MSQQQQHNQAAALAGIIGQVGCITVFIIAVALGGGMLLDQYLGTDRLFTFLFVVGSVPVTLYMTVRISLSAVARVQQAKSNGKTEEERNI